MVDHRKHHVAHLAFVPRRHEDDIRNGPQVGDVEQAVMRGPIAACDAATVEAKLDVQVLNADVVNELIKSALQER